MRNQNIRLAFSTLAVSALVITANAQSKPKMPGAASAQARFSGTLGASASASWVRNGDVFEADCLGQLDGNIGITLRFNGFAAPVSPTDGNSFVMDLKLEVTGNGVVYNGPAAGLNSQVVHLDAATVSSGVALRLSRRVVAQKDVPAGIYANRGEVIISRM